jgi:hypothetical protein
VWLEEVKAHCRDSRYHYMQDNQDNPAYSVRYYVEQHRYQVETVWSGRDTEVPSVLPLPIDVKVSD